MVFLLLFYFTGSTIEDTTVVINESETSHGKIHTQGQSAEVKKPKELPNKKKGDSEPRVRKSPRAARAAAMTASEKQSEPATSVTLLLN